MRALIVLLFLAVSLNGTSQYRGYYGKKNIVEFSSGIRYSIFNTVLGADYEGSYFKKKGSRLLSTKNRLDYALRFNYSHAFKGNFAMGFEYSIELGNIACPENYDDLTGTFTYYENLRMQSHVFIPKFEFASKSSLLPIGLSHQVGVGFGVTKIAERDYLYSDGNLSSYYQTGASIPVTGTVSDHVDYGVSLRSLKLLYEMHIRTPLTKWLNLNYGFRYNLNVPIGRDFGSPNSNPDINSSTLFYKMRSQRWRSLITFNLGVGFIF